MSETLMMWGRFRFAMDTATYQELTRTHAYRWATQSRLAHRPAQQFIGVGEETLELSDIMVYPQTAEDLQPLEPLREAAEHGEPLLLVDGLGFVWGLYVMLRIQEGHTFFLPNGVPRKQTFSLSLKHYGEEN